MKLVLISGDGAGAGKTYAARLFGQSTWTLADGIRGELAIRYPNYNWYNRTQEYKNHTHVKEWERGDKTVREVLLKYGQVACAGNPKYWVERLCDKLKNSQEFVQGVTTIAVDDVRKVCELEHFRANFRDVVHIHVESETAVFEPEFEAEQLKALADYVVRWQK